jgi:hypothetical protein
MKKSILVMIIVVFMAALVAPVIAEKEGEGVHADITIAAATTQVTSSGGQEIRNRVEDRITDVQTVRETIRAELQETGSQIEDRKGTARHNISDVLEARKKNIETLNATLRNASADVRERVKNENEVRIAVTTLLDSEDLSGGIGHNISEIARDFNNSLSSTGKLEDRIQGRSSFTRIFFGGDRTAARELANQTAQGNARIAELQQLISSATLDPEVRTMLEEQVRILQQEQERLQQLATREQADRGIFGWLG